MKFSFKQIGRNINNFLGAYDEEKSSDDEKLVKEIIENSLKCPDVKKIIVPVTGSNSHNYLLIDEKNKIYISVENNNIDMSNHNFLYKKTFNLNFTDEIKNIIKHKLEEERKDLKESLFQNEIGLLTKIKEIYK
tara:strand:- start:25338 stop:25739 length:402 start_codon:yes stop_codon:yes gene_type:complete